jgi:hypothetical protein
MDSTQRKLLGESIREIGVLILVFVPLDIWITPKSDLKLVEPVYPFWLSWAHFLSVDHWRILLFAIGGLTVLSYGIKIEARATGDIDGQKGDT